MVYLRLLLAVALLSIASAGQAQLVPLIPDGCTMSTHNRQIHQINVPGIGNGLRIYVEQSVLAGLPGAADLVVIVNGNGYGVGSYAEMATHLARNGFVVAVVARSGASNASTDPGIVRDAVDASYVQLGLTAGTRAALLGHSVGGRVVVDAAVQNTQQGWGIPLRSVIGIAPNIQGAPHLAGVNTPAYLLLYGSQDQDMTGTAGVPREAFAAYDRASTESATTCTTPPCIATQAHMDRTMVYVHGANHHSLIGSMGGFIPVNDYLAHADQFCIGKAYVNSFLRWRLRNENAHKTVIRGDWTPWSVAQIVSNQPDHMGNPAGTPLRLQFQVSPLQRQNLQNFQSGQLGVQSKSANVQVQLHETGTLNNAPWLVRHETRAIRIQWPPQWLTQQVSFQVPANRQNSLHFSHVALRLGQLWGSAGTFPNQSKSIQFGLYDGSSWHWEWLNTWGDILPVDLKPSGNGISAMGTIRIPLNRFNSLNRSSIQRAALRFPAISQGTILVDSLEWFRD